MDITCALQAQGPGFDPQQNHLLEERRNVGERGIKEKRGKPIEKKKKKREEKNIRGEERWGIESVWMKKKSYSGEGRKT